MPRTSGVDSTTVAGSRQRLSRWPWRVSAGLKRWNSRLNQRFFGHRPNGTQVYRGLVQDASRQAHSILNLGSGWDRTGIFDRTVYQERRILALDPDRLSLAQHPSPYRILGVGEALPLKDASADLIVSEYVFEHLREPQQVIRECARVLKPGGRLIAVTPNAASYFGVLSKLTPFAFHVWFLARLLDKPAEDTFPTLYRINTRKKVLQIARGADLRVAYLATVVGPPFYTTPLPGVHLLFIALHKLLEIKWFKRWGLRLVIVLEKPEAPALPAPASPTRSESRAAST